MYSKKHVAVCAVWAVLNTFAYTVKGGWGSDGALPGGWYVLGGYWFTLAYLFIWGQCYSHGYMPPTLIN